MSAVSSTHHEAFQDTHFCKLAMNEEISTLIDNETYILTSLPKGKNVIGGWWVYSVKPGINNDPEHKAQYN